MAANELFLTTLFTDANLQAYYRMESGVTDSSANAYNLTANNSPTYVAGQFGNAIHLVKASTQSASIAGASCPNLNITGSQTWMCWIKITTNGFTQDPFAKYNGVGGLVRFQINGTGSSETIMFQALGLTTNSSVTSDGLLGTGAYYHVAGVYSSVDSKIRIYINGSLDKELTASGSATSNAGAFYISSYDGTNELFNGDVDDFAVFNRALTTTEISNYYNGLTPLLAKPKAYMTTNTSFWGA